MSLPNNPNQPPYGDPVVAEPVIAEPAPEAASPPGAPPAGAYEPVTPVPAEKPEESEGGVGDKAKSVALLAGAAALANKVRQKAPKKVQELREKRTAGRYVILSDVGGRQVAIGPYPDESAARQDTVKLAGVPHLIELVSQSAYFQPEEGGSAPLP